MRTCEALWKQQVLYYKRILSSVKIINSIWNVLQGETGYFVPSNTLMNNLQPLSWKPGTWSSETKVIHSGLSQWSCLALQWVTARTPGQGGNSHTGWCPGPEGKGLRSRSCEDLHGLEISWLNSAAQETRGSQRPTRSRFNRCRDDCVPWKKKAVDEFW